VMTLGDDEATALGLNVGRVRLLLVAAATLGTAGAVAVSGLIGFLGIIVPHFVRLVAGGSYRIVLPLSLLVGGGFLAFTDVLARTIISPAELPIGVVTAFFGAPFFAVVPQLPSLPPQMTVAEYVLLGRTPHLGYFAREGVHDLEVADAALVRLDLLGLASRRLGTLSGGERQRAVLARALAQEAPILLLDEPTNALDVGRGQQALELVDALRREGGLTVLAAMHDLTLAGQYADRLLLLDAGRVVAAGGVRDVLTDELIARHYGASVRVLHDELGVVVVPARRG